jgi:hypothetical protein
MQDLILENLPIFAASPVTCLAMVVWYEIQTIKKSLSGIGERLAALEARAPD